MIERILCGNCRNSGEIFRVSYFRMLASTGLMALIACSSTAVAAQEPSGTGDTLTNPGAEARDAGAAADAGDIVVTGSRISRAGFTAPTPVTTLSSAELAARAPSTLADTLATVPSFRSTNTPSSSGVNSRGGGIVTADLRGLTPTRTLVLVNGRRFVPSGTDGVVDLKLIPTLLVNEVEVVTGGASAAYGSDAVAGVVNFKLKDRVRGVEASVQTGISERGDNFEYRASLAVGATALDDRLGFMIGGDYIKNKGIGNQYTREWGRREVGLITNTAFATNGLPNYIISPGVHPSLLSPGGLIVSGPLRGTAFGPGGVPYQFNFGQIFGTSMIGGDNVGTNLSNATQLAAPYESKVLMGRLDFKITPAVELYTEISGAWTDSGGVSQQPRDNGTLTVQQDNAYLPTSVRDSMVAAGLTTIAVGRLNNDSGYVKIHPFSKTFRVVGGVKGELGGGWNYDIYGEYGRNNYGIDTGPNNRIVANYMRAIDAVTDPVTGQIVCRSTLTAPTNGCIPQNIFGDGSVKVDNYSFGTASFRLATTQIVGSGTITGSPFSTWAGPVSIAFGAEYRKEKANGTSDPLSQQVQPSGSIGAFQIGNQLPIKGSYDLWEAFGEAVVPLLRDSALGRSLELNGAVRRTEYSTSGAVVTWKAGVSYEPVDGLRFRATRSRDIRAPNLNELFQSGASSYTNVFDRVLNQIVQVREFNLGNVNLKPERANTLTGGVVYQPHFLRGLSLSLDYYNIKVDGAIGSISTPLAIERCNAGLTQFCSAVVLNPDGTIAYTVLQSQNLNGFKTSGLDVEVRYDTNLGFMPGRLSTRALGTYVDKYITVDSSGSNDRVGMLSTFSRIVGVPHFTGVADITYSNQDFSLNLQGRLIGSGKYYPLFTEGAGAAGTISSNHVPAAFYLSLAMMQGININGHKVEFQFVINNLLDKDPQMIPSGGIGGAYETSTNPIFYDVIGRSFKFGARFKF